MVLTEADAPCVQQRPFVNVVMAPYYKLGFSWNIVVDGDYVLDDIQGSIKDGV